jgi:outer membrane protein OmpA-like peptidoglycan-associated protein
VTGRVDDGNGGAADCSVAVLVNAPPPPPQASKLSECLFAPAGSSRVDNVCKRILDDVALRLQNDPKATIVIVGFADPKEPRPAKLGALRATNAVKYLGEKGIDASRITTRAGAGQTGAGKENRRIDVIWVPQGATY